MFRISACKHLEHIKIISSVSLKSHVQNELHNADDSIHEAPDLNFE
jgi:hypothetical protein